MELSLPVLIPYDCWGEVISYFESQLDYFSLLRSVSGLWSYILRHSNPKITENITFELHRKPKRPITHVSSVIIRNEAFGSCEYLLKTLDSESFRDFYANIDKWFPGLLSFEVFFLPPNGSFWLSRFRTTEPFDLHYEFKNLRVLKITASFKSVSLKTKLPKLTHLYVSATGSFNRTLTPYQLTVDWKCFPALKHLHIRGFVTNSLSDVKKQLEELELDFVDPLENCISEYESLSILRLSDISVRRIKTIEKLDNLNELHFFEDINLKDEDEIFQFNNLGGMGGMGMGGLGGLAGTFGGVGAGAVNHQRPELHSQDFKISDLPIRKFTAIIKHGEDILYLKFSQGAKLSNLLFLEDVYLRGCTFKISFEHTPSLSKLHVVDGYEVSLWKNNETMKNLTEIVVKNCSLGDHFFYNSSGRMKELRILDINNDENRSPSGSFCISELRHLEVFKCLKSNYEFSRIDDCPSLRIATFRQSKFLSERFHFSHLPSLSKLVVFCGSSESVRDIVSFSNTLDKLEKLEILMSKACNEVIDLSNNQQKPSVSHMNIMNCTKLVLSNDITMKTIRAFNTLSVEASRLNELKTLEICDGSEWPDELLISADKYHRNFSNYKLKSNVLVEECPNLESVSLTLPPTRNIVDCIELKNLPKLRSLRMIDIFIKPVNRLVIQNTPNLRELKVNVFTTTKHRDYRPNFHIEGTNFPSLEVLVIYANRVGYLPNSHPEEKKKYKIMQIGSIAGLEKLKKITVFQNPKELERKGSLRYSFVRFIRRIDLDTVLVERRDIESDESLKGQHMYNLEDARDQFRNEVDWNKRRRRLLANHEFRARKEEERRKKEETHRKWEIHIMELKKQREELSERKANENMITLREYIDKFMIRKGGEAEKNLKTGDFYWGYKLVEVDEKNMKSSTDVNRKRCGFCGGEATKLCRRCKKVAYCSYECSVKDWKGHKKICVKKGTKKVVKKKKKKSYFSY